MANISTLTVSLVADTAKFTSGLKKARSNADRFAKVIGGAFKLAAAGAAVLTAGLFALTKQSLALVDQQRKQARVLGTTQAVFAGLSLAAGIAGVSTESFNKALKRSQKSIVDANDGLQTQARAFQRLNLDTQQLIKLPVEKQFAAITTALGKVENQTLKVAIASDIFGAKNADLLNILELGEEGLDSFIAKAKELGVALTEDQTNAIETANDAVLVFKTSLTGLGNQLAARFAPLITAGAEALTNFVSRITQLIPKIAAFTRGLFGVRQELNLLTAADIAAEIEVVREEFQDAQIAALKFAERTKAVREGDSSLAAVAIQSLQELEDKAESAADRLFELSQRRAELEKEALAAPAPTVSGGGAATGTLSLIDVNAIRKLRLKASPELLKFREDVKAATADAARIFEATRTPVEMFVRNMANARRALRLGDLDPEAFDRFKKQQLDLLVGLESDFDDFTDNLEAFADEAARNMQDAFADFFFDPFENGIEGLVSTFADALRRMVANLLATDLLNFLNPQGGGGFFGFVRSIFGRQIGGPVQRGVPVRVGESGPEVFTPGASGSVRPVGDINFSPTTIIQGGGNLDNATLIPLLEENNRKLKGEFVDELRRGSFA
jgi:hypothetical protein